jgi:hypothetical protein
MVVMDRVPVRVMSRMVPVVVDHGGRHRPCTSAPVHRRRHDPVVEVFQAERGFAMGSLVALSHNH